MVYIQKQRLRGVMSITSENFNFFTESQIGDSESPSLYLLLLDSENSEQI